MEATKTKTNITDAINALVEEYFANRKENGLWKVPYLKEKNVRYHINNGLCDDFADIICEQIEGAEALWGEAFSEEFWDMPYEHWIEEVAMCHCFIVFEGRYYDAEAPNGVDHPRDLPLYINHIAIIETENKVVSKAIARGNKPRLKNSNVIYSKG